MGHSTVLDEDNAGIIIMGTTTTAREETFYNGLKQQRTLNESCQVEVEQQEKWNKELNSSWNPNHYDDATRPTTSATSLAHKKATPLLNEATSCARNAKVNSTYKTEVNHYYWDRPIGRHRFISASQNCDCERRKTQCSSSSSEGGGCKGSRVIGNGAIIYNNDDDDDGNYLKEKRRRRRQSLLEKSGMLTSSERKGRMVEKSSSASSCALPFSSLCSSNTISPPPGVRKDGQTSHKSVTFLLNLLLLFLLLHLSHDRLLSGAEAGNIPLGVVFEQGSPEIQSAFAYALTSFTPLNISSDPRDKFAFNAYVDTINTADAFKLSKLICNQFFRGVYAIVGSMNSESFQTFHSYANTFQMPIVTPGFPTRPRKVSKFQVQQSLSLNSAMDFVTRGENSTLSPLVRSPLINDTFQKLLDTESAEQSQSREELLAKLVEEIVVRESERLDFVTKIRPDLHQAIMDITAHYGWKNVIYLFHSNEGLLRLQSIFEKQGFKNESLRVRVMKRISSVMDALSIIRNLEVAQRFQPKHIILDCPASLAKDIIISHVRDLHLGRRTYHYLIAGLAFDEPWERSVVEFTAVNVTGFRMVDPDRKLVKDFLSKWATLDTNQFEGGGKRYISATAALMYDGMLVIKEAFTNILRENPEALRREKGRNLTCNSGVDFLNPIVPFEHGKLINERLRRVQAEGLTGHIQFSEQGSRSNFTVDVMEITLESGQSKAGEWSDVNGFVTAQQLSDPFSRRQKPDKNREYIVTSILEEPYLMMKKAEKEEKLTGNDQYEGFCKDLADLIAKNMNIKYKIVLVRDKKYGSENPVAPGGWDGMIGELIREEADVAISSLTITAERERVIDFTKPYLNLGISIMFYKPKKANSGVFGFMSPLSTNTWYCVIVAYIGVSLVLFVVSRCNATEWITETEGRRQNQFSVPNSFWFCFAALVQQGSDLTPRSFAGRLVGSVWWFFTLILISSYTANFAAVRTVNRMVLPIKSAKELSEQTEIQYGTLLGGSTFEFFRRSEVPVYKRMFEFMSGPNSLNVKSYDDGIKLVREKKGKYALLIESPKNDYTNQRKPCDTMKVGPNLDSKGFGIGTPLGSSLKHQINLEVLRLKENGILSKLESKWWFERSECDVTNKQETATGDEELSLGSLAGIFYILIAGLVLSMFVSFLEFCYNSKKEAQKSKLTLTEAMKKKAKNTITGPIPSGNGSDPVTCIH
ncbi:unnamed protein product [Orchesella dallaii]|uniref:Glutamate receptor 1 n=1 Tax=Orchesella dallaii TaxID=48710 RepID=A0ABP1RE56_9HEXA